MRKILRFAMVGMMALVSTITFAQTTVTFDATVDKGTYTNAPAKGEQYDTLSKEGVTIVCNKGAFNNGKQYRFGKSGWGKFESSVGNITKVVLTCTAEGDAKYGPGNFTDATAGSYTYEGVTGTWTGDAASFQLTASGSQVRVTKIEVTYGGTPAETLAAPEIKGDATFTESTTVTITAADGASIYYTLDGQDPDDRSGVEYTAPFTLTATTTVKAIAYKGDLQSQIATAEFTKKGNVTTTGNGTLENPYTAADALALHAANALPEDTAYYAGVITSVKEVSTNFGNATYYIGATTDASDTLQVFRGYYLQNKKFTAEDQIKVGDNVIVRGKLIDFKGDVELGQRNYIYSLNGKTTDDEPTPEPADTASYNVAEAVAILTAGTETKDVVYVTGKISQIGEISAQYGNATYYISDDGTTNGQLEVFRGRYLNNAKFTSEDQIKVGDEVKVAGVLTNYEQKDGSVDQEITNSHIVTLTSGTVDGINNVKTDAETIDVNAPLYNLAGQRVNKSFKGVVIQNGHKFLLK